MNRLTLVALAALAIGLAGCGKKAEAPKPTGEAPQAGVPAPAGITVSNISIGNSIGPDKRVMVGMSALGRNDTFYASVDTKGSGTATLKAKWTYMQAGDPMPVNEDTLKIDAQGPGISEFHISKPDGWPPGDYQIEVFVDGVSGGTRRFTVN